MTQSELDDLMRDTMSSNTNKFSIGAAYSTGALNTVHPSVLTGAAPVYAPNNGYTFSSGAVGSPVVTADTGITLSGNADIKFGNVSLKDFMQQVTLRLNMMVPNPQLERQWDELRTLGEAYRACEKECLEKAKVWDILKRD